MPSESTWRDFIRITSAEPPWPRLVRAAGMFDNPGDALDVGPGGGRDTRYLLLQGWRVTAVDASPSAVAALRRLPRQRNLEVVLSAVEDFEPASYDLVNAQFALPFVAPAHFDATLKSLRDSVETGGVLTATFFGKHDEWNVAGTELTFSTAADIERMFLGWELIELSEVDEDGHTADGAPKHWHIFHLIARRRSQTDSDDGARKPSYPASPRAKA
jgi:tellurite methyltransferase